MKLNDLFKASVLGGVMALLSSAQAQEQAPASGTEIVVGPVLPISHAELYKKIPPYSHCIMRTAAKTLPEVDVAYFNKHKVVGGDLYDATVVDFREDQLVEEFVSISWLEKDGRPKESGWWLEYGFIDYFNKDPYTHERYEHVEVSREINGIIGEIKDREGRDEVYDISYNEISAREIEPKKAEAIFGKIMERCDLRY